MSNSDISSTEEKCEQRLQLLDDHIGRALAQSASSGELRTAPSFGKPLQFSDGYDETPAELRMGYKILKDAGVLPPEVELMRDIDALRLSLEGKSDCDPDTLQQRERLITMRQQLALRLDKLRSSGAL